MKYLLSILLSLIMVGGCSFYYHPENKKDVITSLQSISIIVKTQDDKYGSGVIKNVGDNSYIITAAHLFDKSKIGEDASVIKIVYYKGEISGKIQYLAKIINISHKEDLALLLVYGQKVFTDSVQFYKGPLIPLGTKLISVSSPYGERCYNTVTTGILSQHGRIRDGAVYDQTTCPTYVGTSGGGIYNEEGKLVGISVIFIQPAYSLIIPVSTVKEWLRKEHLEFLL